MTTSCYQIWTSCPQCEPIQVPYLVHSTKLSFSPQLAKCFLPISHSWPRCVVMGRCSWSGCTLSLASSTGGVTSLQIYHYMTRSRPSPGHLIHLVRSRPLWGHLTRYDQSHCRGRLTHVVRSRFLWGYLTHLVSSRPSWGV